MDERMITFVLCAAICSLVFPGMMAIGVTMHGVIVPPFLVFVVGLSGALVIFAGAIKATMAAKRKRLEDSCGSV